MKIKTTLLLLSLCYICNKAILAQSFIKKDNEKAKNFKELQLQFNEWKSTHDLKKEKGWKSYKRWEQQTLMHTDGKGELGNVTSYLDEAIKTNEEKNTRKGINNDNHLLASTWTPVGPFNLPNNLAGYASGMGRINCISFHPTNANTYYVGVAQGGIWKTTNNGTSWTPLGDNLPITRISDIAIDPTNTNTMYISVCDFAYIDVALNLDARKRHTHYGLGVYKTTDGGINWQPTGLSFQLNQKDGSLIRKIIVNPANPNELVACGVSGMYTSSNGGTTWNHTLDTLFWDMIQDPVNPSTLYAASGWLAVSNRGYAAIYKSTNFGATWTKLNANIPTQGAVQRIKLAIAPSDNNYIYACAVDQFDGFYGFYKSTNAGSSWQFIQGTDNILGFDPSQGGGQGTYDLAMTINKTNKNIVYVGGIMMYESKDGAQTFDPVTDYYTTDLHVDIHFIETHPLTGEVFVCSDGGLYKTANVISQTWASANNGNPFPTQWTILSNGLAITSFYKVSSSRNIADRLVAGAQDNHSFYRDNNNWYFIFGGDGMDNYLSPTDDDFVIGSYQYGNFLLSNDDGNSDLGIDPNINFEDGEWTTPIIADYNQPGVLYIGFTNVVKSTDEGLTWTSLANLPQGTNNTNEISAMAVAYNNANTLYVARRIRYEQNEPSSLFKTTNGGTSWSSIIAGLPDSLYITSVEVSQTNAQTVYVGYAGLSAGNKIFMSTNGGAAWQNISYNLPNAPVNCIKTIPGSNLVMAATDFGVYILNTSNNTWVDKSTGLPNVIVSDIEFNPVLNKIYVSTFGRGIWETDLTAMVGINKGIESSSVDIQLYPSPNNGSFTISVNDDLKQEKLSLEVIDVTGKLVYSTQLNGEKKYSINMNLPAGMYFAKIKSNKFNGAKSFIIN